jgi:truncated hemoglobin YjbI
VERPAASLYDRLGGIYSIATVVEDFIDRIMVDERLNANPRVDEAHVARLKEESEVPLRSARQPVH